MKNNKRFLFPFACVCVFLHPKSSRLSHITKHSNSPPLPLPKTLLLFPFCHHPALFCCPFCYGTIAVLIFSSENKKKNKNTNNITQNASPPPSCFANAPKNCHTRASKMRSKTAKKKIIVRARRTTTATAKNPSEQSKHRYATKSRDRARKRER